MPLLLLAFLAFIGLGLPDPLPGSLWPETRPHYDLPNAALGLILAGVAAGYVAAGLLQPMTLAVERFEARGMPIGDDSVQTILWTGRFVQAWHEPENVRMVKRSEVKLRLCGTTRAKDPNVRQALIDQIGPPGTKKAPGPTHGVTSHAWAALAVALVASGMRGSA